MQQNSLILFDQDLRLEDNPAFFSAIKNSQKILPVFIFDEVNKRKMGAASKWFLHQALLSFSESLQDKYALKLILKKGDSLKILEEIFKSEKITTIYFNNLCEPYNIILQSNIKKLAKKYSIEVFSFKAQTLFDFDEIKNKSGEYFKVFTPFFNECKKNFYKIENLLPEPENKVPQLEISNIKSEDLNLLPKINWAADFSKNLTFDYKKILKNFDKFLSEKVSDYKIARDFPALEGTSKISPYLSFGMVSPRQIFWQVQNFIFKCEKKSDADINQFLAELCWREFCHHLLFHFPQLTSEPFKKNFKNFPWQKNKNLLQKWQKGQTGYPIVDAGMRELWATGLMHNRVRMTVASFLIKDLMIHWQDGEEWFWDCLLDANLANNVANWQWVAGSGADAAPYFRIFNPSLQGERFDPEGFYVKKWLPELKKMPDKFIHQPWKADKKILEYAGIELGKNYPLPMVDHDQARQMALMAYKSMA